jgi:hypothetical protein
MKFKSQDKQNQLIENITLNHIVVGVDIAQEIMLPERLTSVVSLSVIL